MFTFFVVLGCIAVLAYIFVGSRNRGRSNGARYFTGVDYEPTHHQILRENILKDRCDY